MENNALPILPKQFICDITHGFIDTNTNGNIEIAALVAEINFGVFGTKHIIFQWDFKYQKWNLENRIYEISNNFRNSRSWYRKSYTPEHLILLLTYMEQ